MTMISESGAILDINEIAAGLSPEEVTRIESASFEELAEEIGNVDGELSLLPPDALEELGVSPSLESLLAVLGNIRESGSISRVDAQSLHAMTASMEGFDDMFASTPINSFTEMPSKVNFDVSMESIFSRALTSVVATIRKIIAWIRSKIKSFSATFRANLPKAKAADEFNQKVVSKTNLDLIKPELSNAEHFTPEPFPSFERKESLVYVKSNMFIYHMIRGSMIRGLTYNVVKFCDVYLDAGEAVTLEQLLPIVKEIAEVIPNESNSTRTITSIGIGSTDIAFDARALINLPVSHKEFEAVSTIGRYQATLATIPKGIAGKMTSKVNSALVMANKLVDSLEKKATDKAATKEVLDKVTGDLTVQREVVNALYNLQVLVSVFITTTTKMSKTLIEAGVVKA